MQQLWWSLFLWLLQKQIAQCDNTTYYDRAARNYVFLFFLRPEGYVEDFNLAKDNTGSEDEKKEMYMNLKTGAESGLDYSTKWWEDIIDPLT